VISSDHTQAHTTVGKTPLDEGSARRRDLYLTTQTLYRTNIHVPGGIRTHDPSKPSAADRLRQRGRWNQSTYLHVNKKFQNNYELLNNSKSGTAFNQTMSYIKGRNSMRHQTQVLARRPKARLAVTVAALGSRHQTSW
jgi:hypothetical protein